MNTTENVTENATVTASAAMDIKQISAPLFDGKMWLKILGFATLFQGAMWVLSIVGIVFAWIPIWIGLKCLKAASAVERAYIGSDPEGLLEANQHLKTAITIMGVLQILLLLLFLLGFVASLTMPVFIGALGQ